MKVSELKSKLRELSLKVMGKRDALIERLRLAVKKEDTTVAKEAGLRGPERTESVKKFKAAMRGGIGDDSEESESDDDEESIEDERNDGRRVRGVTGRRCDRPQTVLAFRDVEDALEYFSGDGRQNVKHWLSTFGDVWLGGDAKGGVS